MKKLKIYSKIFIILFFFISEASAIQDTSIKKQSDEIAKMLKCMTCQNLTIYESDTEFSKQIKKEIYEQLKNGVSKNDVLEFMVQRYGEYMLLKPKLDIKNTLLWILPFVLIISSFLILLVKLRKN